jgi:hypothetical protein
MRRGALADCPLIVPSAEPASPGKIFAGEATEMGAYRPQNGFIDGRQS